MFVLVGIRGKGVCGVGILSGGCHVFVGSV